MEGLFQIETLESESPCVVPSSCDSSCSNKAIRELVSIDHVQMHAQRSAALQSQSLTSAAEATKQIRTIFPLKWNRARSTDAPASLNWYAARPTLNSSHLGTNRRRRRRTNGKASANAGKTPACNARDRCPRHTHCRPPRCLDCGTSRHFIAAGRSLDGTAMTF